MFDFSNLPQFLSPSYYGLSFLDLIIIVIIIFYAFEGYSVGFFNSFLDLISFILSFIISLKWYGFAGGIITEFFSIPQGFANIFGFFILAFFSEIIINVFFKVVLHKSLLSFRRSSDSLGLKKKDMGRFINKLFGTVPAMASAAILVSFLLTVIIALPFSPFLKRTVSESKIGNGLVVKTQGFEKQLNKLFGQGVLDTLNFLTIEPRSDETVSLRFTTTDVSIDEKAEQEMVRLVNLERKRAGVNQLVEDLRLRDLARKYSKDMLGRGYFSHYTPEGLSPFDRMVNFGISFTAAGENLALAPNVDLAMQGLMQSPGHRANILSPQFGKIGVGVIDGGIYGQMYTQEFTD